ncbi:MAG: NFACT RNA binding domain-containing protein [Clostridia bacterium]
MPFDGMTIRCMARELSVHCKGGKIQVISMPEKDEVVFSIHNHGTTFRMVVSVNPSCARIHLTREKKPNPAQPPNFCMFLRKHLGGGKISDVMCPDDERVLVFTVENMNELGDMQEKKLIVELTGRICNIIVTNASLRILDALKHIDGDLSLKRRIMPAGLYEPPPPQDKALLQDYTPGMLNAFHEKRPSDAILSCIKGFSPVLSREIVHRAGIGGDIPLGMLAPDGRRLLDVALNDVRDDILLDRFSPCVAMDGEHPLDFHCLFLTQYPGTLSFDNLNQAVDSFYTWKDTTERIGQKSSELKKTVQRNLERCEKKIIIHRESLDKSAEAERLRLFGELLTANLHALGKGSDKAILFNYHTGEDIQVDMDPQRDPLANARDYFKKYKKLKSAADYAVGQLKQAEEELEYLKNVMHSLQSCTSAGEVEEIRRELAREGYTSKKHTLSMKKSPPPNPPFRYVSSEGYEIFAGRNNTGNDWLTFTFANSRDLWLHAKNIPGSHVIIRRKDKKEAFFPDKAITEAAVIAAYHSRARSSGQIMVDYTEVRNVKKPPGAKPGMVTYSSYFSAYATADGDMVEKLLGTKKDSVV